MARNSVNLGKREANNVLERILDDIDAHIRANLQDIQSDREEIMRIESFIREAQQFADDSRDSKNNQ